MKKITNLSAFAMGTPDLGYQNQLIGALTILHSSNAKAPAPEKCFLLPEGISQLSDMRLPCCFNHFSSYKKFKEQIFKMLDNYLSKKKAAPQIFITAYNMTESQTPEKNVDNLCKAVKEYYKEHQLGSVFTCVLTSKAHNYKYVDLINVPKHLLTFYTRLRLLQNKELRNKTLITVGTIHKFNADIVKTKKETLENTLAEKANDKNKLLLRKRGSVAQLHVDAVEAVEGDIFERVSHAPFVVVDSRHPRSTAHTGQYGQDARAATHVEHGFARHVVGQDFADHLARGGVVARAERHTRVDGDVVLGGDFFLRLPFQAGGVDAAAGGGQFLKGVIDHLVDFGLDHPGADVVLQRFAREHLAVGKFLFDRLTFDAVEEGIVEGAEQVGLEDSLVAECLPTLPQAEPHVLQGVGYDLLVRHIVHAEVFQLAVILLVEMPELLAVRQDDSFPLSR